MEANARDARESRMDFLDGVRGLAALSVVLDHLFSLLLPSISGPGATPGNWRLVPVALLTNGGFAVQIFFVLSGFVLSRSAESRSVTLPARFVSRYLRLTLPMLASLVYAWALFRIFPSVAIDFNRAFPNGWLVDASFGPHVPDFMRAISDGVYGVYRHGTSRFNPVVWTMRSELIGSLIVFAFYRWWPARHRRLGLALFVAGGLADSSCLCFAFGAVLWEGWRAGWRCGPAWSWVIFLLALALSLAPSLHPLRAGHQAPLLAVAAGLLVFGVLMLPSLQAFLGSRGPRFLGRISFALYLLHLPLLLTAGAWLFLHLDGPYLTRVLVVSPLFVGASVVLAWLMTVVLDEPLLRWLHRWRKVRGVVAS